MFIFFIKIVEKITRLYKKKKKTKQMLRNQFIVKIYYHLRQTNKY